MSKEIDFLIDGYKKFRKQYFGKTNSAFKELALNGQNPKVLIIACSDSRVDPAIVTNCQPGELFVIRNVANLIPPYEKDNGYHGTSAALEFGICNLEIKHIIIFGHSQCGGILSLFDKPEYVEQARGFTAKWMDLAKPAFDSVLAHHTKSCREEQLMLCGQYSLINSLRNLHTFPWINERIQKGQLFLHAWYFDLSTGMIRYFDTEQNAFRELKTIKR